LSDNNKNNYIIGEFEIKEDNKYIRIINSYEQFNREYKFEKYRKECENEKEIKENCDIFINDKLIPFSYFHKFHIKGNYKIKYIFKNNVKNTNYMFRKCSSITSIDLSNFNTNNVNNMKCMFYDCSSLKNINISNCSTNNVKNMEYMFYRCKNLNNLDLSNFNTNNVNNMRCMFYECESLKNLNLSNFNTDNVQNMENMFYRCKCLINLDLSNFNTKNVNNMANIFSECVSLTKNTIIIKDNKLIQQFNNCSIY
jgi:surface protein